MSRRSAGLNLLVRRALLGVLAAVVIGCASASAPGVPAPPNGELVAPAAAVESFTPTGPTESARVVHITDGDTVRVVIDGEEHRLRYIGIDTPESVAPNTPVEAFALEATTANAALVDGRSVVLEMDVSERDRFDRLLRYVWLPPDDGATAGSPGAAWRLVNLELIRLGVAEAVDYPPDTKYSDLFDAAERKAREEGVGMWADD